MKKIYMTPETTGVAIKTESFLLTLSSGNIKPEAPDSGLTGGGTIENGGNGDNQEAAKQYTTNVWEAWEKY
nr:hypothetical protein [Prevotella sp.]